MNLLRNRAQRPRFSPWRHWSLATRLLVPFVTLVAALTVTVGWLLRSASNRAVDELSAKLLGSIAERVSHATREQLSDADLVLSGLFARKSEGDETLRGPLSPFESDSILERRFYEATAVRTFARYIYYGREDGTFIGVERQVDRDTGRESRVLAKIVTTPASVREEYHIARPGDRSRRLSVSQGTYDARTRPWYRRALEFGGPAWSEVYASFSRGSLLVTHVQPVRFANGVLHGVLAADVPLFELSRFLAKQNISPNGVAYIVDGSGRLIASSFVERLVVRTERGDEIALPAGQSANSLVRASSESIGRHESTSNLMLELAPLGRVQVAVRPLAEGNRAFRGLDWRVVVAAPQSDFTAGIAATNRTVAFIAGAMFIVVLALGAILLRDVADDIEALSIAADRLGEGEWPRESSPVRGGELGKLWRSFLAMAFRLRESQAQIQEKNLALARTNADLESRVQARTHELEERNLSLAREIIERKSVDLRLRELSAAVEQAADGMMILELNGSVRYANPAYERITGFALAELKGQLLPAFESARVLGGPFAEIRRHMEQGEAFHGVVLSRRKTGEAYWAEKTVTPIHNDEGDIRAYAWVERDVTDREREREWLERRLTLDPLTGLYNRESIETKLQQALQDAQSRRSGHARVAVIFLDLDGFKSVNDRFGHDVGDEALREAGRRLKAQLRGRDSLARVGGDEFVAVLPDLRDRAGAEAVGTKFVDALVPVFSCGKDEFQLGTSLGIAVYPDDATTAEVILRLADQAMLAQKRARKSASGRARGEAYTGPE
jgi:diguanylate cyclase (GGDEF)-like protein/PAS domain S-box-containing protein